MGRHQKEGGLLGTIRRRQEMYCTPMEKPRARKPHKCTSCGEDIAIGETYYRWRSYDDGGAGTNKMHPECHKMHSDDAEYGEWEYTPYSHDRPKVVPNMQGKGLATTDSDKGDEA